MFRSLTTSLALVAAVTLLSSGVAGARPHATPTPAVTPTPIPEDPAATRIARQQFVAWQAGVLDKEKYTDSLYAQITPDKLKTISENLGHLGALTKTEYVRSYTVADAPSPGYRTFIYHFVTVEGGVYEQLVLTGENKVAGIVFTDKQPNPDTE